MIKQTVANTKNIEIEIQVQIEHYQKLLAFLKKEAKFVGEKHQVDQYFIPAHRDFTKIRPIAEWLRLRNSSGKFFINYKKWNYEKDGRSHYADEFESEVESLPDFEKIFKALDIKPLILVDKKRVLWMYKNWEIAVDKIKNLGDFIEIEFKGATKKTPDSVTKEMIQFLKKLGVGKITRNYMGYPYQMLFPKEIKYEVY